MALEPQNKEKGGLGVGRHLSHSQSKFNNQLNCLEEV